MTKKRTAWLALLPALLTILPFARAQSGPESGVYQIISGTYVACCGIGGEIRSALPTASQSFVKLTVDPQQNMAAMSFLGADLQTVFQVVPCPTNAPINFSFDHGFVSTNQIAFHVDPAQTYWNYLVTNSSAGLRINGTLGIVQGFCADVPNQFTHSDVVAVLMPATAIRVSEVEVCWNSITNLTYQVQYVSAVTTNALWTNLGSPLAGNGATLCITDKVPTDQPQRLYRVLTNQ